MILTGAVFGFGRAGQIHGLNILTSSQAKIKYIVDVNVDMLKTHKTLKKYQDIICLHFNDAQKVLQYNDIDFCIVTSPTFTHEEIVSKCIRHNKHVFVEKPLAEDYLSIQNLYKQANDNDIVLHCSMNRRFDPALQELRNHLKSDSIGSIHAINVNSRDHPTPSIDFLKTSGGIIHDCAIHDLDLIFWMLAEWPIKVFATASCHDEKIKEINDFDTVTIVLTYSSGIIATICLSRHATYGYDQRVEALGNQGCLQIRNTKENGLEVLQAGGIKSSKYHNSFPERYRDSYCQSLSSFLEAIEEKKFDNIIDGNEVVNVSLLANACEESIHTGKTVQFTAI